MTAGYACHKYKYARTFHFDTYVFRLQSEGNCLAVIGNDKVWVRPGDLLLFRPGDSYQLIVEKQAENKSLLTSCDYYVFCEGEWVDRWWRKAKRTRKLHISLNKEISDYFLRLLCLHMDRLMLESEGGQPRNSVFLVRRMKEYVEKHSHELFRLQDVADDAGNAYGVTPQNYRLRKIRMNACSQPCNPESN